MNEEASEYSTAAQFRALNKLASKDLRVQSEDKAQFNWSFKIFFLKSSRFYMPIESREINKKNSQLALIHKLISNNNKVIKKLSRHTFYLEIKKT